jgi:hypothetical protein
MDLDFLPRIVAQDNEGLYPWAERALRYQLGCFDFNYKTKGSRNPMWHWPRIDDPAGLVRSLYNLYACAPMSANRQQRATFLDRGDKETR